MKIGKVSCVFALLSAAATSAFAQGTSGALLGTVTDPGHAAVPGAKITVTYKDTGATRAGASDNQGAFEFPDLLPGTYSVVIAAKGFKALQLDNVSLSASEKRNLGTIAVQIGAVTETVNVTAEVTPVNTSTADVGQTIDSSALNDIGLKGRDPFQLIDLLPGVIDTTTSRDMESWNSMTGIVINGLAASQQSHLLDGMANDDDARTDTYVNPNPDAISEIRVSTSGFQAEFGRNAGGVVNFTTKSGTLAFHGTGHWDHRNEDFNANSFFNNRSNITRPIYRYMILGYSIGGPVILPKTNKFKNKFFFFFTQEFARTKTAAVSQTVNEPTALERSGDFSKSVGSTGALIPVINPSTGVAFSGNIIPPSLLTPLGVAMLNQLHLPTGYVNPAPGQQFSANSLFTGNGYHHHSDTIGRFDANVTKKLTMFYRHGVDRDDLENIFTVSAGVGANLNFVPESNEAGHATWTISPTMVSETGVSHGTQRYGWRHPEGPDSLYYRTATFNPPTLFPIPTTGTTYGGNELPDTLPLYQPFVPAETFGGGLTVGQTSYNPGAGGQGGLIPYNNRGYSNAGNEDVTKIYKNHTFKFGVLIQQDHKSEPLNGGQYMGAYNFASTTSNPLDSGNGYANALLGNYQTYTQSTNRIIPQSWQYTVDFYIQDSWRVSKRLTAELGLRFDHMGAPFDQSNTSSNFSPGLYTTAAAPVLYRPGCKVALSATGTCSTANLVAVNPLTNAQTFNALVGTVVPGVGNIVDGMHYETSGAYWSYPYMNYAPRLGLAWDPMGNGKTSVRASAGVFFNRTGIQIPGIGSAPVVFTPQVLYGQVANLSSLGASAQVLSPTSGTFFSSDMPSQRLYSVNFSVQRQIGFQTVLQVAYVGNFDRHAPEGGFTNGGGSNNLNIIPYQAYADPKNVFNGSEINQNFLRSPYPGMGTISYATDDLSDLNYHGVSVSAQRRLSHGFFFGASYTFSKALGTSGSDVYHTGKPITTALGQTVTLPNRRQYYYGPTGSDRSQVLSVNYSYAIPSITKQKFLDHVLGKWTLSGITSAQTGAAYSPSCSTTAAFPTNDPTLTGIGARCQEVGDPHAFTQSFYTNFNTSAFVMAPVGTWGTTGLGIYRQPTTVNFDMSLDKVIPLGNEKRVIRIKWQAFNVFNHTEFNGINSSYNFNASGVNTNTTTGQYTGTLNPRQMVLTLRFEF